MNRDTQKVIILDDESKTVWEVTAIVPTEEGTYVHIRRTLANGAVVTSVVPDEDTVEV